MVLLTIGLIITPGFSLSPFSSFSTTRSFFGSRFFFLIAVSLYSFSPNNFHRSSSVSALYSFSLLAFIPVVVAFLFVYYTLIPSTSLCPFPCYSLSLFPINFLLYLCCLHFPLRLLFALFFIYCFRCCLIYLLPLHPLFLLCFSLLFPYCYHPFLPFFLRIFFFFLLIFPPRFLFSFFYLFRCCILPFLPLHLKLFYSSFYICLLFFFIAISPRPCQFSFILFYISFRFHFSFPLSFLSVCCRLPFLQQH